MNKKSILLIILLFSVTNLFSQIKFDQFESFQKIIDKAKKEKKLIFIQFESADCQQCFEVAKTGLSGLAAETVYNANFINTTIKIGSEIHIEILKKYDIAAIRIGAIYLDNDGFILLKMENTTSFKPIYLDNAEKVIKLSKNNPIKDLEKRYQAGEKTKELLLKLIDENAKNELLVPNLVNEYFEKLTIGELKNTDNIRLMFEHGLPLNNYNRKIIFLLHTPKTIDSVFFQFPLNKRIKINQSINIATDEIAIRNKDVSLAYELKGFINNLWGNDYKKGWFYSQAYLTNFYKNIKDTTQYLQQANNLMETQIMRNPIDSLKKMDVLDRTNFFKNNLGGNYMPFYLNFATELNNNAFAIFEMSKDYEQLGKALKWSKRSLEIFEALSPDPARKQNPSFMDTYASLLYRTNNAKEAIIWQNKAIEIAKNRNEPYKQLENTLTKMKDGTL